MHEIKFSVKTLSPLVISAASNATLMTESHDEISGSIIRGVLANRYIKKNNLENTAYTNENFRKLFYGGLKFLSATPAISNKRSFVLPLSLQRGKKGTANEKNIADLFKDTPPAGYKSLRGYGIVDGDKIITASVKKNIFMHMSRSTEKERISGKSEEGHIYNYEALEAGQIFHGSIIGAENDLKELQLENKSFVECIGRSRFTQYGKCEFTFEKISEIEIPKFGEKIYLRLESPLIAAEDNFIGAEKVLTDEVIKTLGENFSLGKVFAAGVEIENFVKIWGMKSPRVMALAAGTVFEINAENLTDADKNNLAEKIYSGFGVRTEEGFGQLRIWTPQNFTPAKLESKFAKPNFSAQTITIAKNILLEKYLEQLRILAQEDANKLTSQLQRGNFTHFFSRLNNILASVEKRYAKYNFKEAYVVYNFKETIKAESKDGTLFQDNLKKFYVGNHKLYDILTGNVPLPYELEFFLNEENHKICAEIDFKESDYIEKFQLEYLQNFFRAARKIAALKGGDNND